MHKKLKIFFRTAPGFRTLRRWKHLRAVRAWEEGGRVGTPPPPVKQRIVKEYAAVYHPAVFIETGTYLSEMVAAVKDGFRTVHTVEIDPTLYDAARDRFASDPRILVHLGDSSEVLLGLLREVSEPCLFWLDAHFSAGITSMGAEETPIVKEIRSILSWWKKGSVVLIDDARSFGTGGYPTLEELRGIIASALPSAEMKVEDDVIRITDP